MDCQKFALDLIELIYYNIHIELMFSLGLNKAESHE